MNPLNFLLSEKLRQRHLAAELKRSKAFTNPAAITPLFDAIAAISKRTGKTGDEITAEHYADESRHPEIAAAIAFHKPKPAGLADLKAFQAKTGDRSLGGFLAQRAKPHPAPAIELARKSQPTSFMKTTPSPVKAPQATASHTAATFATPAVTMTRLEFSKLTPADKSRFSKTGGKLI